MINLDRCTKQSSKFDRNKITDDPYVQLCNDVAENILESLGFIVRNREIIDITLKVRCPQCGKRHPISATLPKYMIEKIRNTPSLCDECAEKLHLWEKTQ